MPRLEQKIKLYTQSFGTERFHEYCVNLGKYCLENSIEFPYEIGLDLTQFLIKYNLIYTLYL